MILFLRWKVALTQLVLKNLDMELRPDAIV